MRRKRATRRLRPVLLGLSLLALTSPGVAAERWVGLSAMPRLAIDVAFSPIHPELAADEVRPRIEEALRRGQPGPTLDPSSADRLRLVISVRALSSSELRGYHLPLSQMYGIGPVRLAVERPAFVSGVTAPIPVVVWQTERMAKGPWRASGREILELVDEMIAAFLADYRRAQGP